MAIRVSLRGQSVAVWLSVSAYVGMLQCSYQCQPYRSECCSVATSVNLIGHSVAVTISISLMSECCIVAISVSLAGKNVAVWLSVSASCQSVAVWL